jgi:hypothetical protein
MTFEIHIREGEIEARSLDKESTKVEIIKWNENKENHCYTLAIFEKTKGGYELRFIGSRPFREEINHKNFWNVAKICNDILDMKWCNEK